MELAFKQLQSDIYAKWWIIEQYHPSPFQSSDFSGFASFDAVDKFFGFAHSGDEKFGVQVL